MHFKSGRLIPKTPNKWDATHPLIWVAFMTLKATLAKKSETP